VNTVGKPDEGKPHVRIDEGVLETARWAARGGHSPERGETAGPRTPCTPPRQRSILLGIICRTKREAQHAVHAVRGVLQKLKLQLYPTKTRLMARAQEGFDFLGLRAKHTGKLLPYTGPSQKAMKAIRREIHGLTSRQRLAEGLAAVINQLNPVIAGWRNYFRVGNRTMKLQALDRYIWCRVRRLVRAIRGSRGHWKEPVFTAWLQGSGLVAFYQPGVCGT
jgi:RNA-directed DNA polymerase